VASGKGGVGKTWFATTLAHALAREGERVLLVDGDLGLANIDVQLGITPQWDLSSVLSGRVRLSQAIQAFPEGRFDILAGRSGSGVLSTAGREKLLGLRQAIYKIARRYDRVLLDLGAGIDATVRLLMGGNGTVLAVTTSEPTALTDAYAFIKVAHMKYPQGDIRLVVNSAETVQDGKRTYATLASACRNFLKIDLPLAGIVLNDRHVRDAILHQTPILTRHPTTPASVCVESLCRRLRAEP
ncbi:MAG: MinD/ParA family protein, partial [Alphaproteobacteria bacterium]|nr:MinD/ParA family protein [Alphaproteobacteria bacterium]